jgi:hypothetical protein
MVLVREVMLPRFSEETRGKTDGGQSTDGADDADDGTRSLSVPICVICGFTISEKPSVRKVNPTLTGNRERYVQ